MVNDSTSKLQDLVAKHTKEIDKLSEEQTNMTYEI